MTEAPKEPKEGPPTVPEAAKLLKEQLEGLTAVHNVTLKSLMADRDLADLAPEKARVIKRLELLQDLAATEWISVKAWLQEDEAFRAAFERRRSYSLKKYGLLMNEHLAEIALSSSKESGAAMRLYYQLEGKLPVGGGFVKQEENRGMMTDEELDRLADKLSKKAEKPSNKDLSGENGK